MNSRNVKELLPIGSVVLLKGAEKRVMIFGVCQTDKESGKEFDYIAVLYPEGNLGDGMRYLFNHEDIEKIEFKGYHEQEREEFLGRLQEFYDVRAKS